MNIKRKLKVKNISNKVIGIGSLVLLPGDTGIVPTKFETNPVINDYVDMKALVIIEQSEQMVDGVDTSKTETDTITEEDATFKKAQIDNLKNMNDEEIGVLANQLGIDLAACKDQADILKKVRAALKK